MIPLRRHDISDDRIHFYLTHFPVVFSEVLLFTKAFSKKTGLSPPSSPQFP